MDGIELIEGVEVPYVLATVACQTPACRAYGEEFTVRLYQGSLGASCGSCSTARTRKGLPPHRHTLTEDVRTRLAALEEPAVWRARRRRAERLEALLAEVDDDTEVDAGPSGG